MSTNFQVAKHSVATRMPTSKARRLVGECDASQSKRCFKCPHSQHCVLWEQQLRQAAAAIEAIFNGRVKIDFPPPEECYA